MKFSAFLALGLLLSVGASSAPKKEEARKEPAKPEPKPSVVIKADPRTGELPRSGVKGADALGRTQTRYDNGVTAVKTPDPFGGSTTRYSNGVTATTLPGSVRRVDHPLQQRRHGHHAPDSFGGTVTTFSDGTRATTRKDPFGNQVTTYSDGRQEVLRPDPFAPKKPDNERK
jgi:hypothetical protein